MPLLPEAFLLELDPIAENAYYFLTNQLLLGIYETGREICYRHYSDFIQDQITITQLPLFNNLFG